MEPILERILTELQEIREQMTTKHELQEIREQMTTKHELQEVREQMTTKQELQEVREQMATKQELQEIREQMATKQELQVIREQMATKQELQVIREQMATKHELQEIQEQMATKQELQHGFAELKHLMMDYHLENIAADEKLLEAIITTNHKLDRHMEATKEQFVTHEHAIEILHRNQLKLETEVEKLKAR